MTHSRSLALLALSFALLCTNSALSLSRADNFVLLDHQGKAQELYYNRDAVAVVLVAQSNQCTLERRAVTQLTTTSPSVRVFMINSLDSRADIRAYASEHSLSVPVLHDSAQIIGQALNLNNAGEALVIDPRNWQILYQGVIGDAGLNQAVLDLAAGRAVEAASSATTDTMAASPTTGCSIEYTRLDALPDYAADIAPILKKNCMACHIEGGIGPWAMTDYRMIQGFAPMIREVIRVKRMPPWHADPEVGHWQNSARLSDDDTRNLVSWIEAGAPRGEGEDPLLAERPAQPTWPLGEPGLVLELPSYDIPASGVVDYQFPVIANPLDRDVWVVAATIIPGNSKVVHHVLMGSAEKAPEKGDRESVFQNYIMGYAPGNESAHMPKGTGVFVPVGGVYQFQLHYTPTGIATTDSTRVALYFADEAPANFLRQQVVLNPALKIPPRVADHEEVAYFEFWDDATIFSLVPHSHYRGKSSTFVLEYPDGKSELILSVPNYDFNWQRTYSFQEPKLVPKGTRIVHRTLYDNSENNLSNPDPAREVPWGLQSWDEMLYGSVSYSWKNESSAKPTHSNLSSNSAQFLGFRDKDMDGKLSKRELPERMRESLGWFKWWFVDTNFDGGLDREELEEMFSGD